MLESLQNWLGTIQVSTLLDKASEPDDGEGPQYSASPEIIHEIKSAQTELLFEMDRGGTAQTIVAFLVLTVLAPAENALLAWSAFGLYCATSLLYFQLHKAFSASDSWRDNPEKWTLRLTVMAIASGVAWGFGSVTWFNVNQPESQAFVAMIIMGVAATSIISRTLHLPAMLGFILPATVPLLLSFAAVATVFSIATAILGSMLAAALVQGGRSLHRSQVDSIALRHMVGTLKQSHALAREARDTAEAGSRAKSEFLAMMSHEVRTPLNGILGMAQVLQFSSLAGTQKEHVDAIVESGNSLLSILNDILDLSKMEAGRLEIQHFEFDAASEVLKSVNLFRPAANEKSVEITILMDTENPLMVIGDPQRLRQVLNNLIGNAVKFTESGTITIVAAKQSSELHRNRFTSQQRKDDVLFTIADTGVGIAKELQPTLFNPFTQADQSNSRKFGGTGLGLSICQRLVTLMDGSIGFESTPGKGSTFWFGLASQSNATEMPAEPLLNVG